MNHYDYIEKYINEINIQLLSSIQPKVVETRIQRYPLYCNCVDKTIYVWSHLFKALTDEQKKLHIIHSYSALLAAKLFGNETTFEGQKSIHLPFNPEEISVIICEVMDVKYCSFLQLQRHIYPTKERLFPYPDPRGSHYKPGDLIRQHLCKYQVIKIYCDNDNRRMVISKSLNSFDYMREIEIPEKDMIPYYRILKPVEYADKK